MEVEYHEEYVKSSRGVQLFTCRWLPSSSSPKALVFLCHGYGMECGNFMKGVGTKLASQGYAVFGIDYEGHGRSMGARCYIKRFENIVCDCSDHFKSICAREEYREKRRFLYGESMGGAVALLIHKKDPSFWHGAVLVAPMCKVINELTLSFYLTIRKANESSRAEPNRALTIFLSRMLEVDELREMGLQPLFELDLISEKVKPHPVVISLLTRVEDVIPKWKIVPTKDVINSAFKDPIKREEIRGNKLIYQEKPRLKTALEMLRTSMNLEDSLNEVSIPFFVLHGESDMVTDPEVSRALYEQAGSSDKTIKLYPGMWHALTAGEPDDSIEVVFTDIISWLDKHVEDNDTHTTNSIERSSLSPVPDGLTTVNRRKHGRKRSHATYLCGWKGRGLYHQ